jgi:hypothetical protein
MSANCKRLFIAAVVLVTAGAAVYRPRTVYAYPEFLDRFKLLYPEAAGSKLTQAPPAADCALTCHRAGYSTFSRYGLDFYKTRSDHSGWTIDQVFTSLEANDSDGDGTSNEREIRVSQTYPGDVDDRPLSAATVASTARVESDATEATPADNVFTLDVAVVNTAMGSPVTVLPQDSLTGLSPVALTFSSVTQPGNTLLTTSSTGPALPIGLHLGTTPLYYDLTTTVPYSPPIALCITYPAGAFATSNLRLLHYEAGAWVDVTTSVDIAARTACGAVSSLSPFVVAQVDGTPPTILGMPAPGCTLSPVDGRLVTVATVTATDAVSGVASLSVTARSSEPEGKGLPDIVIHGGVVQLRAERTGTAPRIYTIDATATDKAGNVSSATATCVVPRSRL